MELGVDTRVVILAAGLMFVWALLLGIVKYRQILASPDGRAHPYTDIAHRAALLYSFALMLVATFVELSAWGTTVNLAAASVLILFFFVPVAGYMRHGLARDTTNQLVNPGKDIRAFMQLLIAGELGGFLVLLSGFVVRAFG